ncbi:phosphatase PAP2 family protein [Paenibacillus mendelii]|uniref:Phosphatase PAP2 family protein n=1 Tax=Paenibacillus mendelii TaxID=206163 RepID=A0ABV6JFF8_9BACL|nr:phosphatase PAP2 family protein [Paenibacillus mendelii]MCQ6557528.1 phosphatase PAP2 family protein [Paenibacillus mendelii]
MKNKIAGLLPLLWLLAIPVLNLFYTILNHGETNVRSLVTGLDERIPFVPAFIIPYVIWYPFIITMLIVLFLKNRRTYYRTLLTLCLGLITCYIIYYFYQTTVGRPIITENGPLYGLVKLIYATDRPYNCFPSIHVFTSYLMLKGMSDCANWSRTARLGSTVISWTIIVSTLFVKQHVWLDIVGGIVVAEVLYAVVRKWIIISEKRIPPAISPSEDHLPASRPSRSSHR